MELLQEEAQKDVYVSNENNEIKSEAIDSDDAKLYDSFRDRFNIDYEDNF